MCFSATGSFVASVALAGIGATSLARNRLAPVRFLAAVPLLFAAQQAAEGFVWLDLAQGDDTLSFRIAVKAFLGIALVVWPVWFPFSLLQVELSPARCRWLRGLLGAGVAVSAYAAWLLASRSQTARIVSHSIHYWFKGPDLLPDGVSVAVYLIPVAVPFFVSSQPLSRTMGYMLLFSMFATVVIQRSALMSVWCFFAAILSGLIYWATIRNSRVGHSLA